MSANSIYSKRVICFFAVLMLLGGCSSVPKSFTEGAALYKKGDFEAAARSYALAAQQAPKEESIPLPLAQAHFKVAEAAFRSAEAMPELNLRPRIEAYRKAREQADKAQTALNPALSRPYSGPSFSDRMKRFTDAKYKTLRELQEAQGKDAGALRARAAERQNATETRLAQILNDTAQSLANSRAKPGSGYDELVQYFPYVDYLPEVRDAKAEVEQTTIRFLDERGIAQIEALDYAGAEQTFRRLATILGGDDFAAAGAEAIESHRAFMDKSYEKALANLIAIRKKHPKSSFYKNYYEKTRLLLVETRLIEVDALIADPVFAGWMDAFERLARLSEAAVGNETLLGMLEQRRKTLRPMVAADLLRRAGELKSQDEALYSSLLLRHWRLARQFDPAQFTPEMEADAAKASGLSVRKNEIKILLAYDGVAGLAQEWAKRIEADLFAALEKSAIPGLTLLDRMALKGADASELDVADLVLNGSVDAVEFTETGRDSPRRRSSKYISGTRQVGNPKYQEAERAYRMAEYNYNQARALRETALRQCANMSNTFARIACEAAVSMISSADRDSAYAKWQATPAYLNQDVISTYQYDHYTIRVNGLVRASCALSDNLVRAESKCTPVNDKIKREGTIIANAKQTDTEGIRDAQIDVPDKVTEQEAAYDQMAKAMTAEVLQRVAAERAVRYCKLADLFEKESSVTPALEAYSLCAEAIANTEHERRAALEAKLNGYLQLSPAQAQAFGAPGNEAVASWPAPAEIDDKDLKAVKIKLGRSK